MRKQKKKYDKPRKSFDKARIEEENVLKEKYGLKNKREIWKADSAIGRIRNQAKELITASEEEKNQFIERLQKKGFSVESIADALALNKEDLLRRRLQTIVFQKQLSNTPKQARQFIAHKHIKIGDRVVNIPSYQVTLAEETLVSATVEKVEKKDKTKLEKIKQEVLEGEDTEESSNEVIESDEAPEEDTEEETKNE